MLVLTRKVHQSVIINGNITLTVLGVNGSYVRIGLEAPREVPIIRQELIDTQSQGDPTVNS